MIEDKARVVPSVPTRTGRGEEVEKNKAK